MRANQRILELAVALLPLAAVPPAAAGGGISHVGAPACGSLSLSAGAPGTSGELGDVGFSSGGQSWAVGNAGQALHANQTLIERFNGSQWSVVSSPNEGNGNNALNGVSMTGDEGWAVGYAVEGGYRPLALHYDGTRWSLDSPAALANDAVLTRVDTLSGGSAWAAGFQLTAGGTRHTLIEHTSGGSWAPVPSPNDGTSATDNSLTAIAGTQATGLWAVGWRESSRGLKPLVLRYDTTRSSPAWVSVTASGGVPSPGAVDTVLTGVAVRTASDVWAVGYYSDGSADRPLALHWNGSTWTSSPVPGAGLLREVTTAGAGNVWAAGSYFNASAQRYQTLVVHFDGTAWTSVVSADPAHTGGEIIGLAAGQAGSMINVVGRQGPNPLVEQARCATGPVSLPTRAAAPVPPVPAMPGAGPAPSPPPKTHPPAPPVPVKITDKAAAAGIGGNLDWSFSAAVADFNNDGWPDLFIAHHWHPANLWLNNHDGTFSSADAGYFQAITDRHDCRAVDVNSDGLEDLFCSVGADRGTAMKSNALYIQQPNHTFVDQAYRWNVADPTGRGRYGAVLDVNNDGLPDIFYGTESLRPDGLPSTDRLYLNTGHGSFVDDPGMGLDLNIGSLCAHTVDYNSDGWPDLLVCGESGLQLFKNDKGHGFQDVSPILGAPVKATDASLIDVNHDSRPDLITLTGTILAERLQKADGTFTAAKPILTLKNGVSLAAGDVNGDYNPDIYVVCGRAGDKNAPDYLLLGNGTGGFATASIPQATAGGGEGAYPVNYRHDGLASFLVLNGQVPNSGPVQLLTPQPQNTRDNHH